MANITVSFDEMNQAATHLTNSEENISTTLNGLKTYIGTLIGSGFVTDQASKKFGEAYDQFTRNATDTIGSLTEIAQYLQKAAERIAQLDADLSAGIQR